MKDGLPKLRAEVATQQRARAAAVAAGQPIIAMAAAVIPPIHMYRQLKGSYDLSRFGAAWRTVTLMMFSLFALTLCGLELLTMEVIAG